MRANFGKGIIQFRYSGATKTLALAALGVSRAAFGQTITVAGPDQVKIVNQGKLSALKVAASQIFWSPDGTRALLLNPATGSMACVDKANAATKFSIEQVTDPVWSPTGQTVLVFRRNDLIELDLGGHLVADLGTARPGTACWSPDSKQVAYAKDDQVMVAGPHGQDKRQVVKGRSVQSLSWSPDGSTLAFTDAKGSLLVVRPNGKGLAQIASAPLTRISWSPNSRFVMGFMKGNWLAVDRNGRYSESVQCDPIATPMWTGGQKLIVIQNGSIRKIRVAYSDFREDLGNIESGLTAWAMAPQPSVDNDLLEGRMTGIRRPQGDEVRFNGYIDEADPQDGAYKMVVESMIDSRGWETDFAQPLIQRLRLSDRALQTDGHRSRKLQSGDLHEDDHVAVIAQGGRVDSSVLPVREVQVEGEEIVDEVKFTESFTTQSAAHLNSPDVEYDGITRQKIVVPIVFPVVEQVHYIDSFLYSRGGGTRRHHGQDLMGRKMMHLVACFSGTIRIGHHQSISGNCITLKGDNGWQAFYCHLNDDTPGTQDCSCGDEYTFAPGLVSGMHVHAGQFLGYMGNSGDAKSTSPHLHFELKDLACRAIVNATGSLRNATHLSAPSDSEVAIGSAGHLQSSLASRGAGGRGHRSRVSQATRSYQEIAARYASQNSIDPELVLAVIEVESQGNPNCRSGAGACGLMQLMPGTWSGYGVQNPFDPEENIRAGTAYLGAQIRRFRDIEKGLTAYNAGPGRVLDGSWKNIRESAVYAKRVLSHCGEVELGVGIQTTEVQTVTQTVVQDSAAIPPAASATRPNSSARGKRATVQATQAPKPELTPEQQMLEAIRYCRKGADSTTEETPEMDEQAKEFLKAANEETDPNATRGVTYSNVLIVRFSAASQNDFKLLWIVNGRMKGAHAGIAHSFENGMHRWAVAVESVQ